MAQLEQGERDLVAASVGAMIANQASTGAFVASPDFAQYQYCWLRDGSFIAYALDRSGEHAAADRFHRWCLGTLGTIADRMDEALARRKAGRGFEPSAMPPARFSLDGKVVVDDDWPNFQIDGYGTWLWALGEHLWLSGQGDLASAFEEVVRRTSRYLAELALEPCFDVWEENGGEVHTSTLACVIAGLAAAGGMLRDEKLTRRADDLRNLLEQQGREAGRYVKSDVRAEVDGSIVWLAEPFEVLPANDPPLLATVEEVEHELLHGGGVRRYAADTYFGGGAWPVLTCSLGSVYAATRDLGAAQRCLDWTSRHFDEAARLGEQFGGEDRDPENYRSWVKRWGPPATELLWSHAMYVILALDIAARRSGPGVAEEALRGSSS